MAAKTQVTEGNKLIAEFIGAKIKSTGEFPVSLNGQEYYLEGLKYHKSWDWLMPVVKSISELVHKKENFLNMMGQFMNVQETALQFDINTLWVAVVDFINWYNQNHK